MLTAQMKAKSVHTTRKESLHSKATCWKIFIELVLVMSKLQNEMGGIKLHSQRVLRNSIICDNL